ncbi:MAG: hypothetical protein LRY67_04160 [Gammaproteobacteria bacterium]|nr:hypothetical protein [Gammaproteobacteria bacterium]
MFVTLKSKQVKQQKIKALQEIKTAAFPALIEEDENTTNHNPSDNINLENILGKFSETRKETIINTLGQASFFSRTQRALAPYGLPKPCRVN